MKTPAVLLALLKGEAFNARVAATPGGIEQQEAAGQAALVESDVLPRKINGATREQLTALGFQFGADIDEVFVECELPAGWSKKATEHSMHSDVLDDKGRKRAELFFKAAFYDRRADMSMIRRYSLGKFEDGDTHNTLRVTVQDSGESIHELGQYKHRDFQRCGELAEAGERWLQEHFPQWEDPLAYWD